MTKTPKADQLRAMREANFVAASRPQRPARRADLQKAITEAADRSNAAQQRRAAKKAARKKRQG